MKIEGTFDYTDALVIIDTETFSKMDEEFLYAFDIYLDKEGKSELIYDFPGEKWEDVWNREVQAVNEFLAKGQMIVWSMEEGQFVGEIEENEECNLESAALNVVGKKVILVSASELIQCLLYPDLEMEVITELTLEPGEYIFAKENTKINYWKK